MLKSLWRRLQEECSGAAAYQSIADISRYHRMQASPGFRQAAEYVRERLAQAGVEAEVLQYPANTHTTFLGSAQFPGVGGPRRHTTPDRARGAGAQTGRLPRRAASR